MPSWSSLERVKMDGRRWRLPRQNTVCLGKGPVMECKHNRKLANWPQVNKCKTSRTSEVVRGRREHLTSPSNLFCSIIKIKSSASVVFVWFLCFWPRTARSLQTTDENGILLRDWRWRRPPSLPTTVRRTSEKLPCGVYRAWGRCMHMLKPLKQTNTPTCFTLKLFLAMVTLKSCKSNYMEIKHLILLSRAAVRTTPMHRSAGLISSAPSMG